MKPHEFALEHPWAVVVGALVVVIIGIRAFFTMPTEYFPDTHRPQVVVITVEPGASADDISHRVTEVIEKELASIDKVRKITSSSRDEVSAISVEFEYSKPLGQAVVDVRNALSRIRAELPEDILEPRIYQVTDATRPVLTLALSPKKGSNLNLTQIRLLAENDIKDYLLNIPGVSDIDIFGGYKPEISIKLDKDRLDGFGLNYLDVLSAIKKQNITAPAGSIYTKNEEILLKTEGEFKDIEDLKNMVIAKTKDGYVHLKDVADVKLSYKDLTSLYHGNFHPAIAINILRPVGGSVIFAIKNVKARLAEMQKKWPQIKFEITDDQEPLIDRNTSGMRSSLYMAIILTVVIIFLFLADIRSASIALVSIPLSFLFGVAMLSLTKYTINIVTLSGLIIATGMVVDATVVVVENINRYKRDTKKDPQQAVKDAVQEILLSIIAGMLTTVVMIIPIMFAGGYVEKVLRQFTLVVVLCLVGSLLVAVFVVPPLAIKFGTKDEKDKNKIERSVLWFGMLINKLADAYVALLKVALKHRLISLIVVILCFLATLKIVGPIIGRELMPPMDTGIMKIFFELSPHAKIEDVEKVLTKVEEVIKKQPGVLMVSSVVGSEPGEISFGSGAQTKQQVNITVNLVTRDQRDLTIWEIEDRVREELAKIPGIRTFQVYEFGATPMATSRAPIDLVIYGPDPKRLFAIADEIQKKMIGVKGLYDFHKSWWLDKPEFRVYVNQKMAKYYMITPQDIAQQLKLQVGGVISTKFRLKDFLDIPIRISLKDSSIKDLEDLSNLTIYTPKGPVPLRTLADIKLKYVQTVITREDLKNTIDLTGYNRTYRLSQVMEQMLKRLKSIKLPEGYGIKLSGTFADMKESMPRVMKAVILGISLLVVLLAGTFESFLLPIPILIAIPLAIMGSLWGLLAYTKPMCMPAMMGMLLLAGIVINNSIFLIDFIKQARAKGIPREDALINSVRLRLRPVLMTTISTFVGMLPIIYETAVGLERMSPLGTAAGFGLLVGTVMTMVITPVTYSLLDDLKNFIKPKD